MFIVLNILSLLSILFLVLLKISLSENTLSKFDKLFLLDDLLNFKCNFNFFLVIKFVVLFSIVFFFLF